MLLVRIELLMHMNCKDWKVEQCICSSILVAHTRKKTLSFGHTKDNQQQIEEY